MANYTIIKELRSWFPGVIFTQGQLHTSRYLARKRAMKGFTPFQALKKLLDKEMITHTIKYDSEDPTKPTGLSWATAWSKKQWVTNSKVQLYDCTYKTNNKKLALFQVVGLNSLGMAYSMAWGFINNERQEFDWLMEQVDHARQEISVAPPEDASQPASQLPD
ncbi:hypothetical protein B0T25DRAFT_605785 [Lasiosphaeria hispida]|uniref:MULE transposase domain-containing protein n=1 Tax=Lasiosphaeria hispida TaxID=260671 RepID=A0AAJ0MH56_9PEZI|nr:hypothetical protein B0T25DRAFT_605785 [Lasiosphaeria hispida]